jgi:hypothetical protein
MVFSVDELMQTAVDRSGSVDLGDIPFEEPLGILIASLERDANLNRSGAERASEVIVSMFMKRLDIIRDRKANPAIAEERIVGPVFIIGLPRTGSTHLHALMAQVEGVRAPLMWEMSMPSPPPRAESFTTDPRIARTQAGVDQLGLGFQRLHVLAATRPEQCNALMDWSFINQAWTASWEVTTYKEWLYSSDYTAAFAAHRYLLQHLQWRVPGTWVLKYPKHLVNLPALLMAYPDAKFVWTHRDPGVVVPSALTLTSWFRSQNPSYDPLLFGREWATLEEFIARRGVSARDSIPGFEDRCIDVFFRDLMTEPHSVVARICALAGFDYSESSHRQVQAFLDDNPRGKHGENHYMPEQFGLTADGVRRRFAFYIERFNVPIERKRG